MYLILLLEVLVSKINQKVGNTSSEKGLFMNIWM